MTRAEGAETIRARRRAETGLEGRTAMRTFAFAWLFAWLAAAATGGDPPGNAPKPGDEIARCEQALKALEEANRKGEASVAELDEGRERLAEARCAAAKAKGDVAGVQARLKDIERFRSMSLTRYEHASRVGGASEEMVDRERERLAEIRIRIAEAEGNKEELRDQSSDLAHIAQRCLARKAALLRAGLVSAKALKTEEQRCSEIVLKFEAAMKAAAHPSPAQEGGGGEGKPK